MSTNQQAHHSIVGRFFSTLFFRIIPAVLIIAIAVSLVQVITVWLNSLNQSNQSSMRQDDYIGTATAIAPEGDADNNFFHFVQFATNTPIDETSNSESGFPTNTPLANATEQSATATQASVQSTPIALPTFYAIPDAELQTISGTTVPPRAQLVPRENELVNIVLLGSDGDIVEDNTIRTDTIVIVSINTVTQSISMLNIPRDVFVYVPTPTMARINSVYGIGENFGWAGGGFGLLRETIFYNFGIQVHYYAFVEISGLVEIIDAVGGVNIAVDCAYQDPPLVDADVPSEAIGPDEENVYILPVGYYTFTGREAMWYARSRGNSDAFDRGRRHIQLLEAIFRAARDNGQITQIPDLWAELTSIVETDITLDVVLGLLPIAVNLDSSRIERFNLVRTLHTSHWRPSEGAFAGQDVHILNPEPVYQLMVDFYTPPPASRLSLAAATIGVYNGTDIENLDVVASERLRNAGLNSIALGYADEQNVLDTQLVDYAAQSRGSAVGVITSELNIASGNVSTEPDPNRAYDYIVMVGETYNSCSGTVLPIE